MSRFRAFYNDRRRVMAQAAVAVAIFATDPIRDDGALGILLIVAAAVLATDAAWIAALNLVGDHDSCDTHTEWLEEELERTEKEAAEVAEELQDQIDKLQDEHLFLSGEVARLTDRNAELESVA